MPKLINKPLEVVKPKYEMIDKIDDLIDDAFCDGENELDYIELTEDEGTIFKRELIENAIDFLTVVPDYRRYHGWTQVTDRFHIAFNQMNGLIREALTESMKGCNEFKYNNVQIKIKESL